MDDKIYKHVYFRLESGYKWGVGLEADKSDAFFEEIVKLFTDAGWNVKEPRHNGSCPTVSSGVNYLYLHPMDASGVIDPDLIESIETLLSHAKTFCHYCTDVYEDIHNWTKDEYREYLNGKRDKIVSDILASFTTKRKNLYIQAHSTFGPTYEISKKVGVKRVDTAIGMDGVAIDFCWEVFQELVNAGKIVSGETKYGTAYRTAKRRESVA